ncbi:hypothetical protein PPSIR1_26808 [Plesiocystis pacifica SIR-1]|uniref:Uncharacterized protein n=1 Tax=Plesiocystis pacifica SIR-1 TaxID=391625 RepID=A6GAC7_9BACT|nr:hypothetical protein PPSIR1_26808 [Plesiocystis pacifica SIR-1]
MLTLASLAGCFSPSDDTGSSDDEIGMTEESDSESDSGSTTGTDTGTTTETETGTDTDTDTDTGTTTGGEPGEVAWTFEWGAGFPTGATASSTGEILFAGSFFEPLALSTGVLSPTGGSDVVLMGLTGEGELEWAASVGGPGEEYATAYTLSPTDQLVLGTIYMGTPDFGDGPLPAPASGFNGVLMGFDGPDLDWHAPIAATNTQINGLDVNGSGFVIAAGEFSGMLDFAGGTVASAGASDAYYARVGPGLSLSALVNYGSTGADRGRRVLYDGLGGVYFMGEFSGGISADDLLSAGGTDVFVIRFNTAGNSKMWVKRLGGLGNDQLGAAAVDDSGRLVLTGNFEQDLDYDGEAVASSGGGTDAFLMTVNSDGSLAWATTMPGPGDSVARHLAIASDGTVSVGGDVYGAVDLGDGAIAGTGELDGFLARYAGDGAYSWGRLLGSVADDRVNSLGHDDQDRLLVGLSYTADLTLSDGTTLAGADSWRSALICYW